jgi:hypothetical protein
MMIGEHYEAFDRVPDSPGPFDVPQYRLDGLEVLVTRYEGGIEVRFNQRSVVDGSPMGSVTETYSDDEVCRIGVACKAGDEDDWTKGVITLEHIAVTSTADPFTSRSRAFDDDLKPRED